VWWLYLDAVKQTPFHKLLSSLTYTLKNI
jgi:hypothetical protein